MERVPLSTIHLNKLAEYGLNDIPKKCCRVLKFKAGETIQLEDNFISWLGFVVSGKAKICRTAANGKSLIICYYVSEGLIGEIELLINQEIATASVIAISDFECVAVSYQYCKEELKSNIYFSNKLGALIAGKLSKSCKDLASTALYSGEQRLCSYIIETSNDHLFRDVLTDVACSIGISYRHLNRILGNLCKKKILEKKQTGYFILNYEELSHRANHDSFD